jgi:hypothetical protein
VPIVRTFILALAGFCGLSLVQAYAIEQSPGPEPNSNSEYRQLRSLTLSGGETVSVSGFTLRRDVGTFQLRSGTVCFVAPVQGKVTGAVFIGDGGFTLDPPLPSEKQLLSLLSKEKDFVENFSQLVLRFTDATYEEIKKAGGAASGGCDPGALRDSQDAMRHDHMLKWNLEARLLQDVLSLEPGGFFLAFIHGKKYNSKEIFVIDPHGAPPLLMRVDPEEVEFLTYDENKLGVWTALHLSEEYKNGTASGAQKNSVVHIDHQQLDTTIEKSANLIGKATTVFVSRAKGLRVVSFDLHRTLRVQSVTNEAGERLSFIQQEKNDDADFAVILPKPLALGEKYTITTTYSGKDAISNEGNGNYFPRARDDWYPNNASASLGEYTAYDMTFRIPKDLTLAATGSLVSDSRDGDQRVTVWKTEVPQTVAGFNLGRFRLEEAKLTQPEYLIQSYANEELPDAARGLYNTTSMMKKVLAEGQVSVQLYSDYFGPIPYKRLAMTQQTACNFGQAWPALVWLPICSYFDSTVRHALGLDQHDRGYWKIVAPHEVAHQWWGHVVGFNSYRDQWMSEGFAEMSASLFVQLVEKNPKKFAEFWKDEQELLTQRNKEGFRAIDVGPVTMGYRLSNSKGGFNITRDLIYPKGAYILHMVRTMMWDRKTGDQPFKELMQDFVKTYAGRAATTEDFKTMVEKHMTPEMDMDGNHHMDWFFNEYVYGTALPSYKLDYSFDKDPSGDVIFAFKISQSGVDDNFRMLVPIYVELPDGRVVSLGRARITGNNTLEQKVTLKGVKTAPKRALVNYNYDVLAAN